MTAVSHPWKSRTAATARKVIPTPAALRRVRMEAIWAMTAEERKEVMQMTRMTSDLLLLSLTGFLLSTLVDCVSF